MSCAALTPIVGSMNADEADETKVSSAESPPTGSVTRPKPRVSLAHLPTPIEELPRLTELLGGPRLMVKRDDQTGLATGGNKARKLEFLVAEAEARGADTLVTVGSVQSNHCRQTAAAAAARGLKCVLLLHGKDQLDTPAEGNLLLSKVLGAEVRKVPHGEQALHDAVSALREEGRKPYPIPTGGSNAVGATGYVAAMEELTDQLNDSGEEVDWIVHATGSGGTQAGLVVGARTTGYAGKILGLSVVYPEDSMRQELAPIANDTAERLGLSHQFTPSDFLVNGDYLGRGYSVMGDLEKNAIRTVAETEGLLLDPVYTGRAFGGLMDLARKRFFKPE